MPAPVAREAKPMPEKIPSDAKDKRIENNILVICVDPPWRPVSGADLRNWRTVLAARRLGQVTVLSLWRNEDAPPVPYGIDLLSLTDLPASAIFRRPPGGTRIDLTFPAGSLEAFEAVLDRCKASAVIFENLALHPLLAAPGLRRSAVILDMHNVESALIAATEARWKRLMGMDRTVKAVRRLEDQALRRVDEVWICSEIDRDRLRRIHPASAPSHVIPNAVPMTFSAPEKGRAVIPKADGPRLLFVGHLSYRPNIQAARILARSILPAARASFPGASLVLAGRSPHKRVKALTGPGITVSADPVSMAPHYAEADIAVVPLRSGGGTRIKILEAMAAGIPVVASARAVEGLELVPERHFLAAETVPQFAQQIKSLYRDRVFATQIVKSAHEYVEREFGAERIDGLICTRIEDAIGRFRNP
ncbi:MAG: hypothetical protein CML30_12740 [Rhizobiales bacterium]|nr:hypothetical protein [Hyphomicrobiales bacterium]